MKPLKLIFALITLICLLITPVLAEDAKDVNPQYDMQFEASGAEELLKALDEETKALLDELGLDLKNPNSLKAFSFKKLFKTLFNCIVDGFKAPLKTFVAVLGIIVVFSLLSSTLLEVSDTGGKRIFLTLMLITVLLSPLATLIESTAELLKTLSAFLTVLIPILAGILSSLGKILTAGGMTATVLAVCQFMSYFLSVFLIPAVRAATCLGICGNVADIKGVSRLCDTLKNAVLWCFGTASAIFLSILGLGTSLAQTTDGALIRTTKSVVSGILPVMGPLISETLTTAGGCLNILKTGVGIYGIVALLVITLPLLCTLLCWRASMLLLTALSELFLLDEATALFKSLDFCLSMLSGALFFTLLIYIISVGTILR